MERMSPSDILWQRRTRAFPAAVPGLILSLCAAAAHAHHGTSEYLMTVEISLTGTVTEWTFQNPHSWLRLDVPGPDGAVTEWSIESAPPAYMDQQGWSAASLARGEEVTILISPLRNDNEPDRGILLEIHPANGQALIVRPRGRFGRPITPGIGTFRNAPSSIPVVRSTSRSRISIRSLHVALPPGAQSVQSAGS
jgi:hypothetical protein